MSLFSFFRKNKQETGTDDSAFYSRAESESQTVRSRKRKPVPRVPAAGDNNSPVDPVLPEKKRARRRLVGAVALVLAAVIGLPMVLDSEPKPLPDDLTIDIPSKDHPPSVPTPPVGSKGDSGADGKSMPSQVPAGSALDQKEEMVDMPATAGPRPSMPVAVGKSPQANAAGAATVAQPKPAAARPESRPEVQSDPRPDALKVAKTEPRSVRTEPKSDAKVDARPGSNGDQHNAAKPEKFAVQVAALASSDKVDELRGRLKGAGIASYTQKVTTESGARIRIRIGPLNSRQDVDKLRARLAALGLNATVIPSPL